ncbi:MAG: hypothetical protein ACI9GK_002866 [Devosia sp.]
MGKMMSYKEMMAGVQLAGVALVVGWLGWDAANGGLVDASAASVAVKMLWAVGGLVVFNIVGAILATIVISIIQRSEFKDEPSDERDASISARSQRNSGFATSIAAALLLIPLAMGADVTLAVYGLFFAPLLGGTVNAISELVYYRIG